MMMSRLSGLTSFVFLLVFISLGSARVVPLEERVDAVAADCDLSKLSEALQVECVGQSEENKCDNRASCLTSLQSFIQKAEQCECDSDCLQLIEDASQRSQQCQEKAQVDEEEDEDLEARKVKKARKARKVKKARKARKEKKARKERKVKKARKGKKERKVKKAKKKGNKDAKGKTTECKSSVFVFTHDSKEDYESLSDAELKDKIAENVAFHYNNFAEFDSEEEEEELQLEDTDLASLEAKKKPDCDECCVKNDAYYTAREFRKKKKAYLKKNPPDDLQELSERQASAYQQVMNEILDAELEEYNNNLLELQKKKKTKASTCCPGTRNVYHTLKRAL